MATPHFDHGDLLYERMGELHERHDYHAHEVVGHEFRPLAEQIEATNWKADAEGKDV